MHLKKIVFAIVTLLLTTGVSYAQVPMLLNQQGRVLDTTGKPMSGVQQISFKLYEQATGGTDVWSESLSATFSNGYYSVHLGTSKAITVSVLQKKALWIGVTIGSGATELSPRLRVVSVPYAILSHTTTNLQGGTVNATSIQVNGTEVIDKTGKWVGSQGNKGDKGEKGEKGEKGDKGDTGAAGSQGPAGATGAKGDKGDTGATGSQGPPGATGPAGSNGSNGAKGAKGDPGATGATGAKGDKGDNGIGAKGDKGDTGATGAKGAKGDKGDNGIGAKGDKGDNGATGAKGAKGDNGATGATGATGSQGPAGARGATGSQGPKGTTGSQGPRGFTGSTGPQGPIGPLSGCIMRKSCPSGYTDRGLVGIILLNSQFGNCALWGSPGAAYNSQWTWCHPKICCK